MTNREVGELVGRRVADALHEPENSDECLD